MRETTYGGRCEKHLRAKPCELCFLDLNAGRPQLPNRDSGKPAEQQGLFRKFDVRRTDGSSEPGGKHEGCEYFVLDVDHDPLARVALQAYADACDATHPQLSQDLRRRYGLTVLPVTSEQQAMPEPVATLHDDGCFTWKRDEFRLKYDRQRAGWRMDVYAAIAAQQRAQPLLTVRVQSFPESNGKRNWTALLVRVDPWGGLIGNCGGITIERGELWNRVAYEAERAKLLIGERDTEPDIMDYGDDITTPEQWAGEVRGGRPVKQSAGQQRPAFVSALRGLVDSLSREPTEFELRAAAHELTVKADRIAAAARSGGDDA